MELFKCPIKKILIILLKSKNKIFMNLTQKIINVAQWYKANFIQSIILTTVQFYFNNNQFNININNNIMKINFKILPTTIIIIGNKNIIKYPIKYKCWIKDIWKLQINLK